MKNDFDLVEDEKVSKLEDKLIKKQNTKKKGLAIFLIGLLMIGIGASSFVLGQSTASDNENEESEEKENNNEKEDDNENLDQDVEGPSEEENVEYKDYIMDNALVKLSSLPGAAKLYANGVNAGNDIVKYTGYDGYYVVNNNGIFYLKRNQREVSKIEKDTLKIYKDSTDTNSKYISVTCSDLYCNFAKVVNEEYAYLYVNILNKAKSIILNINTGKNKIFDNGIVQPVLGIDKVVFTHSSTITNGSSIVSLDDFSLMSIDSEFLIEGDSAMLSQDDAAHSNSTKYIVVANTKRYDCKYGLYDYQMNKKIDFIYDDLITISDDLLIAKKDNKFGVIDSSNNVVIDFVYDGIEAVDGYYVVIKNDKLGVIDKSGNEIIPFNYSVPKGMEFSLRLCCANENSFTILDAVDQIVIKYYDATRELKDSRFGFYESFIILKKDGTYSKVDLNTKIYGYSEKFYYYDSIENGFNLYDVGRNLYKTIKCDGELYSSAEFVYRNILNYSCGVRDTNGTLLNKTEHYYNVKIGKEVSKDDVKDLVMTEVTYEIYIYTFGNEMGVYNSENKLLLKLDKGDTFTHVYENIYKNVKGNGSVEYYQLIS